MLKDNSLYDNTLTHLTWAQQTYTRAVPGEPVGMSRVMTDEVQFYVKGNNIMSIKQNGENKL